jgi:parallel beta-helix repeat protein
VTNLKKRIALIFVLITSLVISIVGILSVDGQFLGSVYIAADGSVVGTNRIQRNGNTYTLTDNLTGMIVIERDGVTLDGSGYTLQGSGNSTPTEYGQYNGPEETAITLIGRTNVVVKNFRITLFSKGIVVNSSTYSMVINNSITSVFSSIYLGNSNSNKILSNTIEKTLGVPILLRGSNNIVSGNNITQNPDGGIIITSSYDNNSKNNTISENILDRNSQNIEIGGKENTVTRNTVSGGAPNVWLRDSDNIVSQNLIREGSYGIQIESTGNSIFENTIEKNLWAILADSSLMFPNNIYRNNFVNNTKNVVYDSGYTTAEIPNFNFDNGREGNYWSHYNGTDSNGDGIGDTEYVVALGSSKGENLDRYPLMEPVTISPISSISPSPSTSPTPSPSPSNSQTQQPTFEPTQSAEPTTPPNGTDRSYLIIGTVTAVIVAATIVGLAVYSKKYKKKKTAN